MKGPAGTEGGPRPGVGPPVLAAIRIRGFRSIGDLTLHPGPVAALVGEANAGKSNIIAAIRAVLDPGSAPLGPADLPEGGDRIRIEAELADGSRLELRRSFGDQGPRPPHPARPILFLPASLRSGALVSVGEAPEDRVRLAAGFLAREIRELEGAPAADRQARSPASAAHALVRGVESYRSAGLSGLVILIEEPELYLRPHAQRYLYRLLLDLAGAGNQVVYSTHAPEFLNVSRLEDLVLVERHPQMGTRIVQPTALPADEEFRAMSEFDAERSELFLARVAVLVEGRTEKLALPFVFRALGHDVDREGVSIVDCGGKANVALVAQVCRTAGVPFVAVHDRDAPPGRTPNAEERTLNALIGRIAGTNRRVELMPDFEGVAGLGGHKHKPEHAWARFRSLRASDVPDPLRRVVRLALEGGPAGP